MRAEPNPVTGTTVELLDHRATRARNPWTVCCIDHDHVTRFRYKSNARQALARPHHWCYECKRLAAYKPPA